MQSCQNISSNPIQPNIIIIQTDDQGWGDLGIHGNSIIDTPNLDNIAKKSVQFTRFYVSPVCSPTRAELLTGRYHPRGGVYATSAGGERLDLDETTIAEVFKSQGYQTAAFGKWHSGTQPPYHPNNRGFDEFYGFCSGHWGNYFSPMLEKNGDIVKGNGFIIDDFTDKSLEYIDKKNDQPFFIYLAYNTPHSPMQVPDEWWDKYNDKEIDSTHRFAAREKVNKTRAAYALCENIDWNVGRIIKKLESLRLLENTVIVFMSDNGPNGWRYNGGLKGIKGHTDEGGVRSPFLVYWKDKLTPKKVDKVASAIDILPTLTELANITFQPDKPIDGINLSPLIKGSNESWEDRYIFSHWNDRVSVRNQQYILDYNDYMFDLKNDPGQVDTIHDPPNTVLVKLIDAKKEWKHSVLSELDRNRNELFPVGHKDSKFTQLPARDGIPYGNIIRSNRWPNSSYFTNWKTTTDSIVWNCEMLTKSRYKVKVYYTCKPSSVGSGIILQQGNNSLLSTIMEAHDPPFEGVHFDRIERQESYEKNFKVLHMGQIDLDQGVHPIVLKADEVKGVNFIDFRLLVLERI